MTITGLDVSNWQGAIDWSQVPAEYAWGYAKASEAGWADPDFAANWRGMKGTGRVRGAYEFFRPDKGQPETWAQFFLDQIDAAGGLEAGDFLVCDAEVSAAGLPAAVRESRSWSEHDVQRSVRAFARVRPDVLAEHWRLQAAAADTTLPQTKAFVAYVQKAVGFAPLLYSGLWFMQPHGFLGDPVLTQNGLILAAYQATAPAAPTGWSVLAGWQFTDSLTVPGVSSPVDGDRFFGTVDQLRAYGMPAKPAPTPDPRDAEIAALTQQVADLTGQRDAAYKRLTDGLNLLPSLQAALEG